MNTNKSLRAKIAVGAAVVVMILANLACDENPCANGTACGITAPVTSAEQVILDAVDDNPCDNVLSKPAGCQ